MITVAVLLLTVFPINSNAGQVIGSISNLPATHMIDLTTWPPVDAIGSLFKSNLELHTWTQFLSRKNEIKMKLDWSVLGGDNFLVTLYFNGLVLEKAIANRLDGELTQSVTVSHSSDTVQTITWYMTGNICKKRTYYTNKKDKGWTLEKKTEESCGDTSSFLNLGSFFPLARRNYWVWGDKPFSNLGSKKEGLRGGSLADLPAVSGIASEFCKSLLHTWTHSQAEGYKLLLYRMVDENNKVQFYIEIRHESIILDSGIKVHRFDDEMLSSVTVVKQQTAETDASITQADDFTVAYKLDTGKCRIRVYKMEKKANGRPLLKVKRVSEINCTLLYQERASYQYLFTGKMGQNGWAYE